MNKRKTRFWIGQRLFLSNGPMELTLLSLICQHYWAITAKKSKTSQ